MKKKFQKESFHPASTYICSECGKRTRDTGRGEGPLGLCALCYLEGVADNAYNDYGPESPQYQAYKAERDACRALQRRNKGGE